MESIKSLFNGKGSFRRLLVFVTATVLLCTKIIDQNTWLVVAGIFIAASSTQKIFEIIKGVKEEPLTEPTKPPSTSKSEEEDL